MIPNALTPTTLAAATRSLARKDPALARIVKEYGVPPMWARPAGFATLVKVILEQQVSLASAQSSYDRLRRRLGRVTPNGVHRLSVAQIQACGFTRQKAAYTSDLAGRVVRGELKLRSLRDQPDDVAHDTLVAVRGVGPWTADVFLLMALQRPDVWPDGDVALMESMKVTLGLRTRPDVEHARRLAERWRPWRSVAARILWHGYLSRKRKR